MTSNQVEECFQHIAAFWKEEYYMDSKNMWEGVKDYISRIKTDYKCENCGTYWKNSKFVFIEKHICPNCDTYCQPYLSNPINLNSVIKYIDPKYHHYILPDMATYKEMDVS